MNERYALVCIGHSYVYEVHATMKLFVPIEKIKLYSQEDPCENLDKYPNYLVTTITRRVRGVRISVCLVLDRERVERDCECDTDEDDALQYALCHLVFSLFCEVTNTRPPWGMLTGIRPVRLVHRAWEEGKSNLEILEYFQKELCVSHEKSALAIEIAERQKDKLVHAPNEVGLYIGIPFCPTRCSYCSFVSHAMGSAKKLIVPYVEKLCEEIAIMGKWIAQFGLSVHSVYVGGGTPTTLDPKLLQKLFCALCDHIQLEHAREFTVEAGRADTITAEKLMAIREGMPKGIKPRISINPQTLEDHVLQAIGRQHTAQDVRDSFALARSLDFRDINMDLIAGLPEDTLEGFARTLDGISDLDPESVTVHTLTRKRAADLHASELENEGRMVAEMVTLAQKHLEDRGYHPYYLYRQKNTLGNLENVGYAKDGYENLYNILIMDDTQSILGVGCGASTKLVGKEGRIQRIMNYKYPFEYLSRFDELMEKKRQLEGILA